MTSDRRIGKEQRAVERRSVSIDVEWKDLISRKPETIGDISAQGCFVLCSGEVEEGENVKILLPLSDGMKV